MKKAIGIDIGGTRIKAAVVDLKEGQLVTKRKRIDTPRPATPDAVVRVCEEVIRPFKDISTVGVGFPGVIEGGKVLTAQNLDKDWIGFDIESELMERIGRPVRVINDADAAGVAEIQFGAGQGLDGTVILLTIGTGVGSAVFTGGQLVRNTEFGRLLLAKGQEVEAYVSGTAKDEEQLSEEQWADRLQEVVSYLESLTFPERIILGGGGAKNFEKVAPRIQTDCELVHAVAKNKAGIIGAAYWASQGED